MPLFKLGKSHEFPSAELAEPEGILAVGGDLSSRRLLTAYSRGIFPWYSDDEPILWWSPDPRTVLLPENFHVPKRLKRSIKSHDFSLTKNNAFRSVMEHCSSVPRDKQKGTWITDEMIDAYTRLNEKGFADSFEAWAGDKLVGGMYGVRLGRAFFAESMFFKERDASKIVLVHAVNEMFNNGFLFIDAQVYNKHLGQFGFTEIPRSQYLAMLQKAVG